MPEFSSGRQSRRCSVLPSTTVMSKPTRCRIRLLSLGSTPYGHIGSFQVLLQRQGKQRRHASFASNPHFIYHEDSSITRLEDSMARISLIAPEAASPEVREIYETALRGKPGNVQKALAHRPEMLKNFLSFYASVGRSLDRKLYELIYLCVSFINGCHYCIQHHVASSKRVGLTAEDWSALKAGDYSRNNEKERAALTYVEKLTRTPHEITDGDFAPLGKQFSEPEIVDIHLLTGLANLPTDSPTR